MINNKQHLNYSLLFILAGVAIVFFYPAIVMLVEKWQASEDYTHAFIVVPIIGYMIWMKKDLLEKGRESSTAGLVLLSGAILSYLFALKIQIPTLIFLTMVSVIVCVLIYLAGFNILNDLAIPILMMLLLIPIPNQMLSMLTASLQLWISDMSTNISHLFSVPLYQEGNVLHLADRSVQVVDACSGIRSLISMTTLSLIFGYFMLNTRTGVLLLFILSIPVAIVINLLRVTSMVLAYHFFSLDLTTGSVHTFAGLVLFAIGLGLLFSFQRMLELWEKRKLSTS
jgi:exosortase